MFGNIQFCSVNVGKLSKTVFENVCLYGFSNNALEAVDTTYTYMYLWMDVAQSVVDILTGDLFHSNKKAG